MQNTAAPPPPQNVYCMAWYTKSGVSKTSTDNRGTEPQDSIPPPPPPIQIYDHSMKWTQTGSGGFAHNHVHGTCLSRGDRGVWHLMPRIQCECHNKQVYSLTCTSLMKYCVNGVIKQTLATSCLWTSLVTRSNKANVSGYFLCHTYTCTHTPCMD